MSGRVTVHGPYKHRNRWRLHVKEGSRTIASPSYPTRAEANQAKQGYLELSHADHLWAEVARLEEELAIARAKAEAADSRPRTIGELIEDYVAYLRDHKQRTSSTLTSTRRSLNGLLRPVVDMPARALTEKRAAALYRARSAQVAAATHHGNLKRARSLWAWALKQKQVRLNVWRDVELIGKPNAGKDQLHPAAARLIFQHALRQSQERSLQYHQRNQHRGAAAVLILLAFGMRPKEIVSLKPSELDRGLLYIRKGKTRKSRRWLRVPDVVWRALEPQVEEARTEGRERLFPFTRDWVRLQTRRLCREVGVPVVCAYALRGTHATLATEAGATALMVAEQLGHERTGITHRHYIDPVATIEAAANRVLAQLDESDADTEGAGQPVGGKRLPADLDGAGTDSAAGSLFNDFDNVDDQSPGQPEQPDGLH